MFSKTIRTACIAVFAAAWATGLIAGCGGSGGGATSQQTVPETVNVSYEIGGITSVTVPTLSPGDQVQLLATVTIQGVTSPLSPYNYAVNGGSSVGSVGASGLVTAGTGISPGTTYSVAASSSAGTVHWNFIGAAPLSQPEVSGIVDVSGGSGVAGATVTAYDKNMNAVGTTATATDGTFTMSVGASAVQFGVSLTNVQGGYYGQFGYGPNQYTTSAPACLPPLPVFSTGNHRYFLANPITLTPNSSPPPPPASCLG